MNLLIAVLFAVMPPCAGESDHNCRWEAPKRGNLAGFSFVDIGGTAFYLDADMLPYGPGVWS